jgi:hypothetical protein
VRARSAVLCAQSELWITKLSWVQLNSGSVHLTRGRTTALASLTMPACESKRRPGRTWRRPNQRSQSASLRSAVGAGRRSWERTWASKGTLRGAPGSLGEPARRQRLTRAQNVGVNAADANAVFHATGKQVRELPVRLENCSQRNREEKSRTMSNTPRPEQPRPVPKPEVVRPPTPLEEPQPEKGPDLPQPHPDIVVPPGPEVITPSQPQEIPSPLPA